MNDLISIIMPSFNSANTISKSIDSIVNQSYLNWELLITDDCSTDNTASIVSEYATLDLRIKIFNNVTNSGAAVSRNNSIERASGDYIAFLDSDDLWHKDKLKEQLSFMKDYNLDFSFTAYEMIDEKGIEFGKIVDLQGDNRSFDYYDMLRKKATLGCSTVMLKKSAFSDCNMPLIRTGQDYAL
ncbi:glycosyltransferase family 2 protein [Enterobacter ludwigii]